MWGSSHSHLSVICFLKNCAVTLTKQPLGLFRCCVSSEETESYALPRQPSTPTPQIISTNPQHHCFTRGFNSIQSWTFCKSAYKRPVTTAESKQRPANKVWKNQNQRQFITIPIKTTHQYSNSAPSPSTTINQQLANQFKQPNIHSNHPNHQQPNTQ